MKYTLTQEQLDGTKNTYEFEEAELTGMLRRFKSFLQGCSFVILPGEEIIIDSSRLYEYTLKLGKSKKKGKVT
jgi:hypothetical protein